MESLLSKSNFPGDCRFYEAVVRLPLQKAQALDPAGDAYNDEIDATVREQALVKREQCYEIIINALRSLKGGAPQKEFGSPIRSAASQSTLDPASRRKYICQIVQLGVQSPDRIFHKYLYRAMIDLGLENELLEYGGPDLLPFLQSAGREATQEVAYFFSQFILELLSPLLKPYGWVQIRGNTIFVVYFVACRS